MTKRLRLHKDSSVPMYQQLMNEIRDRIANGEWAVGARLPTEAALVSELGVSRITIRQALSAATEAGLVVRVAGKGTFVSDLAGTSTPHTNQVKTSQHPIFIGYVVPHLSSSFNVQTLLGVESILKTERYQLIFCNSEGAVQEENQLLQRLESEGMAGFIIQPVPDDQGDRTLARLVQTGYPVVMIDRSLSGVEADSVTSDHFQGGYAIVQHLIEQGYKDIVYLAREPLHLSSIAERLRGYQAALTNAGLRPRSPFVVGGPTELGYVQSQRALTLPESPLIKRIAKFLKSRDRPEAIVAMNDLHARLVLEAAEGVQLRIPEELALVGYDDLDFAATLRPALTTVDQHPFQLGVEAARLLLRRVQGETGAARQVRLPAQLVIRRSSINPRQERRREQKLKNVAYSRA